MRYVAYGSNLHPLRLTARTPSARLLGTACLPSHDLLFHKRSIDRSGKCSIRAGTIGVYVAVYEISDADRRTLDRIEGVGRGYASVRISVEEYGDCMTYVASETHIDDTLHPYHWYKDLVLEGARLHAFPRDYVAAIEQRPSVIDPDGERSAVNVRLVRQMQDRR